MIFKPELIYPEDINVFSFAEFFFNEENIDNIIWDSEQIKTIDGKAIYDAKNTGSRRGTISESVIHHYKGPLFLHTYHEYLKYDHEYDYNHLFFVNQDQTITSAGDFSSKALYYNPLTFTTDKHLAHDDRSKIYGLLRFREFCDKILFIHMLYKLNYKLDNCSKAPSSNAQVLLNFLKTFRGINDSSSVETDFIFDNYDELINISLVIILNYVFKINTNMKNDFRNSAYFAKKIDLNSTIINNYDSALTYSGVISHPPMMKYIDFIYSNRGLSIIVHSEYSYYKPVIFRTINSSHLKSLIFKIS